MIGGRFNPTTILGKDSWIKINEADKICLAASRSPTICPTVSIGEIGLPAFQSGLFSFG